MADVIIYGILLGFGYGIYAFIQKSHAAAPKRAKQRKQMRHWLRCHFGRQRIVKKTVRIPLAQWQWGIITAHSRAAGLSIGTYLSQHIDIQKIISTDSTLREILYNKERE